MDKVVLEKKLLGQLLPCLGRIGLKPQHQQAQRKLLRRKKSDENQTTVKATYIRHLSGRFQFALSAAIFCSSTNGGQKLEIFSYTEKFGLFMLTILAAAKNLAIKLKLQDIYEATKSLYKIFCCCKQSRALQLQPVLCTIMIQ